MPGLDAVGFDLDGTLLDHHGASCAAVDELVRHVHREPSERARRIWADVEGRRFEQWRAGRIGFQQQRRLRLLDFLPAVGVDAPETEDELDDLFDVYLHVYRLGWRAYPDVGGVLRSLREHGVVIGVLTNGDQDQQLDKLRRIGLADSVDVVLTSDRLGVAKPDPRAFTALAERLRTPLERLVFVGDDPRLDVDGARAAGARAGLVVRSATTPVGLRDAISTAR